MTSFKYPEPKEYLMLKYALGGIVLSTAMHSAALSLGESSGQAIIGRPLDIQVRSSTPLADIESAGCLSAEVRYGESALSAGNVSLSVQAAADGAVIRVRSSVPVNEPVVSVRLQTGCAADRFTRNYTLLADLDPSLAPSAAVAAVPLVVLSPRAEAPVPAAAATAQAPAGLAQAAAPVSLADSAPAAPAPASVAPVRPPAPATRAPAPASRPAATAPARPRPAPRPPAPAPARPAADQQVVASAPAPRAAAAAPVAPTPAAVPAGPRLKLDPVDLSPGRNPGLKLNTELQTPPSGGEAERKAASELWAALNTPPEKAAEDARRLAAMEADLKALREQQAALQASMTALTAQLQAERDDRAPKSLLYALAAALALVGAALVWLLAERRRQRALQAPSDLPWWQSAQNSDGAISLPVSAPAADASAAVAAAATAPLASPVHPAAVVPARTDEDVLGAVDVTEATESSFTQMTDSAPVSLDALLDLVQQVEFFESLQQRSEVAMVLEQFVAEHPASCELPYLLMMRQANIQGDSERLLELEQRYQQAFDAPAPEAACYTPGSAGLEAQAKFMDVLTRFWPEDAAIGLLRNTVLAPPGTGLLEKRSLQAFEDALLLYSVAHTLQSDSDLHPPPSLQWAPAEVAVSPALTAAVPMPMPAAVAAAASLPEAGNGLDIDLSFIPDHDTPPPAEAPLPAAANGDRRELPMLDFDLFAIEGDSKDDPSGKPPEKA